MKFLLKFVKYLLVMALVVTIFGVWGWYALRNSAEDAFNQNAIVNEYLGKVTIEEMNFSTLAARCQQTCDHFLFKLRGEKANALAVADVMFDRSGISSAMLCLADGKNIALTEDADSADSIVVNNRQPHCQ